MRKVFFFIFLVLIFSISQAVLTPAESESPIADELFRQDPMRLAMGRSIPGQAPIQRSPKQVLPPPSKSRSNNFFVPAATGTQPTEIQPTEIQPTETQPTESETGIRPTAPGQEPVEPWPQTQPRSAQVPAQEPDVKKSEVSFKKGKGGISFNFDDADVFSVIQTIFGEVLKVNYIIDQNISGRVNFRTTTPIPRSEILPIMEIILRLNNIGIVRERGLYRIIPLSDISREPSPLRFGKGPESVEVMGISIVQIVPLDFIDSSEMVSILTPLLTRGGVIMDIQGKNYLMIADTDANMKRLLQLVDIFDREEIEESTKPKVYVYPLQNSEAEDLSELLQEIFLGGAKVLKQKKRTTAKRATLAKRKAGKAAARKQVLTAVSLEEPLVTPGTKIFPDKITNSLIILTTPVDYIVIEEVIKKLDIVPRQVLIEVLVAEVTLVDELEFGIEWFLTTNKTNFANTRLSTLTGYGEGSITPNSPADLTTPWSKFAFAAIDTAGIVRALLITLASESKVNVLASPHIMVSDNMEASIQVGDQVPVETGTTVTQGSSTVTTVQYRDTGSVLKVKPHINEGGLVSLDVSQEFSLVSGEKGVQDNPIFSTRTAETHVVVQDGQTIVIGGLIQEDNKSSKGGIPLLKDIPILGYLFGSTKISKNRTELIVLITPHVVKSINDAKIVTDEFMEKLKGLGDILKPGSPKVPSDLKHLSPRTETEKDYSDDEFMKKLKDLGDILESDDRKDKGDDLDK